MPRFSQKLKKLVTGFTLVELLVVITILAIISSIAYINFNIAQEKGRDSRRKQDLKAVRTALVAYYQDQGEYPPSCNPGPCTNATQITSDSGTWLSELVPDYIKELPKDPRQAGVFGGLANLIPKFGRPDQASQGQVASDAIITVSADFDGNVNSTPACTDNSVSLRVGESSSKYRIYLRFPLTSLPSDATITDVDLIINMVGGIGSQSLDIQAYNLNGQANSASDTCSTRRTRSGNDSSPYLNATSLVSGVNTLQLPSAANTDLQTAKSSVDRFSIGIKADNESQSASRDLEAIENSGADEAKLLVTYTTAPAPVAITNPATSVTSTSARLNGKFDPNGISTTAWFRYSQTSPGSTCNNTFGTATTPTSDDDHDFPPGNERSYNSNISGLTSNTTYYFCAIAQNTNGTFGFGAVLTFCTACATPTPTPTPSPSPSPTPTPPPLPLMLTELVNLGAPPPENQKTYDYLVTEDRLYFILWTKLDNSNDDEAIGKSSAVCSYQPPAGSLYNFCVEAPQ